QWGGERSQRAGGCGNRAGVLYHHFWRWDGRGPGDLPHLVSAAFARRDEREFRRSVARRQLAGAAVVRERRSGERASSLGTRGVELGNYQSEPGRIANR